MFVYLRVDYNLSATFAYTLNMFDMFPHELSVDERKYQYNLCCLGGKTEAISIDTMFQTLLYIEKHSVDSASFILEEYLGVIFEIDEFISYSNIHICSLSRLITRYEQAMRCSDSKFLMKLRKPHRVARDFLRYPEIKDKSSSLVAERKHSYENKAVCNAVIAVLAVVQNYPNTYHAGVFAEMMPRITVNLPAATKP